MSKYAFFPDESFKINWLFFESNFPVFTILIALKKKLSSSIGHAFLVDIGFPRFKTKVFYYLLTASDILNENIWILQPFINI